MTSWPGRARRQYLEHLPRQRHESTQLEPLLDAIRVPRPGPGRPRKRPAHLTADRGYSSGPAGLRASGASRTRSPSGRTSSKLGIGESGVAGHPEWTWCATASRNVVERAMPGPASIERSRPATTSLSSATYTWLVLAALPL